MNYNRKKYKYPARYDIEQTLGEFAQRQFVDQFAQSRGVFITKANQLEFAEVLSQFFYSHYDLEEIRDVAYKTNENEALSGFILHTEDDEGDPVKALQELRDSGDLGTDVEIGPINLITSKDGEDTYEGTFNYVNKKPGRIEFLQEENRSFDFKIKKTGENEYQILVNGSSPSDSSVFRNAVRKKLGRKARYEDMDQSALTSRQTIDFFDLLSDEGLGEDWTVVEVKQLVVRRSDDEDDVEEIDSDQLSGITQAVLDGKNLRGNSFVKETEKNGYRFTSMILRFEHNKIPSVIDIKAEFKFRPKVFIVDIIDYYKREGHESPSLVPDHLDSYLKIDMKIEFWRTAKNIFSRIQKLQEHE